jgi:hypothetical protein
MPTGGKPFPEYVNQAIAFYERNARRNRIAFLLIKALQLVITASLTIVALIQKGFVHDNQALIVGIISASLLLLEGMQQTLQLQPLWVKYRATCNNLRREQMLYENNAGPYAAQFTEDDTALKLFAERAGSIIGSENSEWQALQEKALSGPGKG